MTEYQIKRNRVIEMALRYAASELHFENDHSPGPFDDAEMEMRSDELEQAVTEFAEVLADRAAEGMAVGVPTGGVAPSDTMVRSGDS